MAGKIQIVVVANCQGRPLASILEQMHPDICISDVIVVHLAKTYNFDEKKEFLQNADFIIAQNVSPNYDPPFVRTDNLRQMVGDRLITWPNLFFKGQSPDLCYVTKIGGSRVLGPLGEYQHRVIFSSWRAGMTAQATEKLLLNGGAWVDELPYTAAVSLAEFRSRETVLDVKMADCIENSWKDTRLFFTFNHPVKALLAQVATSLSGLMGLLETVPTFDGTNEPLDRIIPMTLPIVAETLGLRLPVGTITQGCDIRFDAGVSFGVKRVQYDLPDMIEMSFKCLDAQISPDTEVRLT